MMPKFASTLPVLLGLLALGPAAHAQIPRTISFQGVLADAAGKLLPDGNHTLTLKLYESAAGSTALYSETHSSIPVVGGVFNAIIGSVAPLPASLPFDRAYFLGVTVDNGTELVPRTALTAVPYALRAAVADQANALAPGATGVVTSINGGDGAVVLQGGGATTVNRAGNTITISSSGGAGGNGIQGVQSPGSSLAVTNGSGPVASIDIADGGVTTAKLAPDAVTAAKLADGAVVNESLADNAISSAKVRDGAITQAKIAAGVSFPASGTAGGDLNGSYPNPTLRDLSVKTGAINEGAVTATKLAEGAVTTAKLAEGSVSTGKVVDAAITSAKIADGTIIGADISSAAALNVATINTTGSAGIGTSTPTARLTVKGSGNTAATQGLTVTNSTNNTILTVRDDGRVGVGTQTPNATLEVVGGGNGPALTVTGGAVALSWAQVQAGGAIAIPNVSVLEITDDNNNVPIPLNLAPGVNGQLMIIVNNDAANIAGVPPGTIINPGQARLLVFAGNAWRLVN